MKFWFVLAGLLSFNCVADEGMWSLNNFPSASVKSKYGFSVSDEWLNHIQLSSALLNGGCSAGFVSARGLVMTNHHCLLSCLERLSPKMDALSKGFSAQSFEEEIKCSETEISKVTEIKDVTSEVRELTQNAKNYDKALGEALHKISNACGQSSEVMRCKVYSFDFGKTYTLYREQLYHDVRLVFVPEFSVALFGGDLDNFEFPRFGFDVAFLRVYENNKPLETKNFFKWSEKGARDGELSFVSGSPGYSLRRAPSVELLYARDYGLLPDILDLAELRGFLTAFQSQGPKQKKMSFKKLYEVENNLKGLRARLELLRDSDFLVKKLASEKAIRAKINADSRLKKQYASAFEDLERLYSEYKSALRNIRAIEKLFESSRLLSRARDQLREARQKPAGEVRAAQIRPDSLDSAPIYKELEIAMLSHQLRKMREVFGSDHPSVKKVLGNNSPEALAENVITGSSTASLIHLAEVVVAEVQDLRSRLDKGVGSVVENAVEKVSRANFLFGDTKPFPEPKFKLRLSFGTVKGIKKENDIVRPFTTIQGAFERHTGSDPYALPAKWLEAKKSMNVETPLNFVVDADVGGGSSGSPVLNQKAEVTGVVFDGNNYSIGGFYGYDSRSRAISVHSGAIVEILKNVYKADRLTEELKQH